MPNSNLSSELYRKLYLIRRAEKAIIDHYDEDEMKTPMHMSMGEEAIVAGVCQALKNKDQVVGTWRSHALYLAKTMETDIFFAEMYGKKSGCAKGKAGSMHLSLPQKGMIGCSAIVAGFIPVAMGLAFANKYLKNNKIVAAFFGDGAIDEGAFWETLNISCLYKLPILFICEDNGLAVHTTPQIRQGYKSIDKIVKQYECKVFHYNGTDAEEIFKLTDKAIKISQQDQYPCFLHFHYYRYLEHVGINEDFNANYRNISEFKKWLKVDPVELQRKRLENLKIDVEKIENEIDKQVQKSIRLAKQAKFCDTKEIYKEVLE